MKILTKLFLVILTTSVLCFASSMPLKYVYDRKEILDSAASDMKRLMFSLNVAVPFELKNGTIHSLKRKLVSSANQFEETDVMIISGNKVIASSKPISPNSALSDYLFSFGLNESFVSDLVFTQSGAYTFGNLNVMVKPVCGLPDLYSLAFRNVERCIAIILVKSTQSRLERLQNIYLMMIVVGTLLAFFITIFVSFLAEKYLRKRISNTIKFLNKYSLNGELDQIIVTNNDEISFLEKQINNLVSRLKKQQDFTSMLVDKSASIILTEDRNFRIDSCSEAWTKATGYTREETIGRDFINFMIPDHQIIAQTVRKKLFREIKTAKKFDVQIVTKAGSILYFELNVRPDFYGLNAKVIITAADVTDAKLAESELRRLIEVDALTGIFTRRGLTSRYGHDARDIDLGLYLIDLDHFKLVNDGYGHDTGDMLLKSTASIIDVHAGAEGTCFRLGGEEFLIIRPWYGWKNASEFAENTRELIGASSISSNGRSVSCTASIGVGYLPKSAALTDVLKITDLVLREAKAAGRNRCMFADKKMLLGLKSRGSFIKASEVQLALDNGEFVYFVQPILNGLEKSLIGFEALIRWVLPSGEMVQPTQFVELLYEVIRQPRYKQIKLNLYRQLLENLKDYPEQYLAINFTIEQIAYEDGAEVLHRDIQSILDHPERKIVIELSEKAINSRINEEVIINELEKLRAYGYQIALDDFGVEASNIQRLQNYPIDIVKIDRSLISKIETSTSVHKLIASLALLLKSLEIDVIVEGVETEGQAKLLLKIGFIKHQGYYYCKPVFPTELPPHIEA